MGLSAEQVERSRLHTFLLDMREIGVVPPDVRDAHALNLAVHVWTVDDVQDMHRLLENGVDGIVTDRPDRLARVLHERGGRPLAPGASEEAKRGYLERLLLA